MLNTTAPRRNSRCAALLLAVALIAPGDVIIADELPEALRKARAARSSSALYTAHIEYSITDHREENPRPAFFTLRSAGERFIVSTQADSRGNFAYGPEGKPLPAGLNKPRQVLHTPDKLWFSVAESYVAHVFGPDERDQREMEDIRRLGFDPVLLDGDIDERAAAHGFPAGEYSQRQEGALVVVERKSPGSRARWWIDPQRDWNIVRTRIDNESGYSTGIDIELAQDPYDALWFPKRAKWVSSTGSTPRRTVEIHAAQFNRPEHPIELTPESIGVVPGTEIRAYASTGWHSGIWNGTEVLPHMEFFEQEAAGKVSMDPRVKRLHAQLKAAMHAKSGHTSDPSRGPTTTTQPARLAQWDTAWEAYTRAFITHFTLDQEQTKKAWEVCRAAQERAGTHLQSQEPSLDELQARAKELMGPPAKVTPASVRKLRESRHSLARAFERAFAPLKQLFERRVVRQLERLPTRAQRKEHGDFEGPDVWRGVIPFAEALARPAPRETTPAAQLRSP